MALEPSSHHSSPDIAAQAKLQTQSPPRNLRLRLLVFPDDMPQTPRLPFEQRLQLPPRPARLRLGKVHRDPQPVPPGLLKHRGEDVYAAVWPRRRVAAEVQPHDPLAPVLQGEGKRRGGLLGGVPPVHREDEAGVQLRVLGLEDGDGGEEDGDVLLCREEGRGARSRPELQVGDAVGEEVGEDGVGGVPYGVFVCEEVVDVAAEEWEEAVLLMGPRGNNLRLQVVVMFPLWHDYKRVLQVGVAAALLALPYFMKRPA
ncbi:hypothetical protein ACJZ2D_004478 [Fusarium nematophilum]